ncbi:Uncharacterised protein [Providencia rettgeri]|uniref:Uncharacterized protein n=2 Tax=Providencia rettgeri TaxID=587 RepID=A0A379LSQ7_PRORE|nr:Uncharacterised protein [Providencia rettgeri]
MVTWRLSREAIAHLFRSTYIILGSPTFVTRGVRLAGYRFPKASEIWRKVMSQYSCIEIIRTKAKKMARCNTALSHTQALEFIAQNSKFSNYHELVQVAKNTPLEPRLLIAAFGDSNFEDVIYNLYGSYTDGPYPSLEMAVEEKLSGEIATTNADGFTIEDLVITDTFYDEIKGILDLQVAFLYQGDQLPDHVYSGVEFEVEAKVRLSWRDEKWNFIDEDFEITHLVSDIDRDWFDSSEYI